MPPRRAPWAGRDGVCEAAIVGASKNHLPILGDRSGIKRSGASVRAAAEGTAQRGVTPYAARPKKRRGFVARRRRPRSLASTWSVEPYRHARRPKPGMTVEWNGKDNGRTARGSQRARARPGLGRNSAAKREG